MILVVADQLEATLVSHLAFTLKVEPTLYNRIIATELESLRLKAESAITCISVTGPVNVTTTKVALVQMEVFAIEHGSEMKLAKWLAA